MATSIAARREPASRPGGPGQAEPEAGWRSSFKGDLAGGLTAAALAVPGAAGLGILALSPLGEQYISHGILAAFYCAVFVPLTVLALGARGVIVYAPRSVLAFLIAAFALQSLAKSRSGLIRLEDVNHTLGILFLVVFVGGLFQAAFGAFRLGTLVKYIPSPVMAGFQNAGAILIFFGQVDPMLGFRRHVPLLTLPEHLGALQPMTLLVGLITALAVWHARRFTRTVPPPIVGLLAGTAAYYLLASLGVGQSLGPVIGAALDIGVLESFRFLSGLRMIIFGGLVMLFLIVRPRGVLDEATVHRLRAWLGRRRMWSGA